VIAAQSIGEPGTQLTMRTFHIGGAASRAAIASSVEAKSNGVIGFNSTMRYVSNTKGELVVISRSGEIVISENGRERERHKVPYGAVLTIKPDEAIKAGKIPNSADPTHHYRIRRSSAFRECGRRSDGGQAGRRSDRSVHSGGDRPQASWLCQGVPRSS
jgi:hypothetical protein